MLLAPSLLAADLADLAGAARTCEKGGADLLHVDVMDGHFVPNLTFGIPVIEALREKSDLPQDVHLMVANPERLLAEYLSAGAAWISVHWETATHLDRLLQSIREGGARAGVAVNPATPVEVLVDVLDRVDFVLLMSVNPGFAGQAFIPRALDKARRLRSMIEARGLDVSIEMDGGIDAGNIGEVLDAGVDICVSGSGVFGQADPAAAMWDLRRRAEESR